MEDRDGCVFAYIEGGRPDEVPIMIIVVQSKEKGPVQAHAGSTSTYHQSTMTRDSGSAGSVEEGRGREQLLGDGDRIPQTACDRGTTTGRRECCGRTRELDRTKEEGKQ